MNTLDKDGFTPFLNYIKSFNVERQTLHQRITDILSYQEFKHKRQTDKYQITNFDIFDSCDYGKNNNDSKWNAYNTWLNSKHLGQNQSSRLNP